MPVQKTVATSSKDNLRLEPSAPKPEPINISPDNGDGQGVVVPIQAQGDGLTVDIVRWQNYAEFPGEFDNIYLYIDNKLAGFETFEGPVTADPVRITFKSYLLQQHGEKELSYVVALDNGNEALSFSTPIFVDTIDPNLNNQPGVIQLPADLPGNTITLDYLNSHNGVTLTIPAPLDRKLGDTLTLHWGESQTPTVEDNVPDNGPITVFVPAATITALGEGDRKITYQLADRAGNETQASREITVKVLLSAPPIGLLPPIVIGAPLINKEMARRGVVVQIPAFTGYQLGDTLTCYWQGVAFDVPYRFGTMPQFPLEFTADYDVVAAPGNEYDADVTYVLLRNTQEFGPPAPTTVAVDLTEPGENNPGPGPVDPNLKEPLVKGPSNLDNVLVPEDRGENATATFLIYTGFQGGERIELYYGTTPGELADTYDVLGSEPDDFEVSLQVPWSLIDKYGNGNIPCYYRIFNAVNYKDSPAQPVSVRIFELDGLEDPVFEKLNAQGRIQCEQAPWLGVPIRIHDPVTLQPGDEVTVHAVRYTFNPVDVVVGSEVSVGPYTVSENDVREGFTRVLNLPYFLLYTETRGRGYVGVHWSIYRASTDDRGSSGERRAQWDLRDGSTSGTCVPGATRSRGGV